ncbi:hypothetical protein GH714_018033 [Hevea brasiliensis]|uniref:Ammonium transporter AmtB-like domain-containing protein n=1 Tax=Hevea brasiliensis TaxID=3981 RepID=A0A6A6M243_HEVBR|nr:hypothetical protein GH714_018033 [Hevea brasiliensis]
MGWSGFNGGAPYAANIDASIAILNTNISAATSLLVWTTLDVIFFGKPSVIGAVQGMMTGLACITPGAGLVQSWAAIIFGFLSGSIPSVSHPRGGRPIGWPPHRPPSRARSLRTSSAKENRGAFYGGNGGVQFLKQMAAASFVIAWNIASTTIILLAIRLFIPLRMPEEQLVIGDDAVHGEEAYALWGDGEKYDPTNHHGQDIAPSPYGIGARGVTINLSCSSMDSMAIGLASGSIPGYTMMLKPEAALAAREQAYAPAGQGQKGNSIKIGGNHEAVALQYPHL